MNETTRRPDPTFPSDEWERRDFTLELPGRGRVVGLEWNPGGHAGRVAILHGLGEHARRYGRAVAALAGQGFAVEALDLPGHGESYGPRGHVESWGDYRDAMEAWWARRRDAGDAPTAIVGHSLGSLVALDFALRHPEQVRAIVLSAPPFEVVLRATMLKVRLAQLIVRVWPGFSQQTTILPSMLSHDPDVVRAHNEDPLI
ncbi:MAG TPA: alpha/beta fold hydrolase, partial [Candidatus Eisenbacteria bacterium]|nr:alpha/beta fold hydrolase [Candidatus Eisenbacteria bacterium]